MTATLAIPGEMWDELVGALDEHLETAAVLAARAVLERDQVLLLARSLQWIPEEHYLEREASGLSISSQGYVPALAAAAADGAMCFFVHTHPGGDPSPSERDEIVDAQLADPVRLRTGQALYGSLIVAGTREAPRVSGRLYREDEAVALDKVRVAAPRLNIYQTSSTPNGSEVSNVLFDRQIRAFGTAGQVLLSQICVGVVGLGGTGSAVAELLIRLGVGSIIAIDDDVVTETNLTRIHESSRSDVDRTKVAVMRAAAQRIDLGTVVETYEGRVTIEDIAQRLRFCDVVFGCTDDQLGRSILSRLAYYYLIPVIDMAFMVDTHEGNISGLYGRVSTLVPGAPCLVCRRRIDPAGVAVEALSAEERAGLAAEGYVPGIGEPDPSVGTFTTMTATFAVNDFLERLFRYGPISAPTELLIRLHDHALNELGMSAAPGHYCDDRTVWGRGDTEPFLEQLWGA